jgi:riboflavin synthase
MFTGIVEELGTIESLEARGAGARLRIGARTVLEDAKPGASIAVNGVCLTAVDLRPSSFAADVAPETMTRSNLGDLRTGSKVNLERPLSPAGRLGGHIMQGHVDGTGELLSLELLGDDNWWLQVRVPPEVERYVVYKGSIGIDGMSLTVAAVEADVVSVTIIPHTYANTTLRDYKPGARLNLECDVLAKYVEKLLRPVRGQGLTMEKLAELGY